jgi:transcriptional regulator with XRE-family HTH domain
MQIGTTLRQIRKNRNMTQKQLTEGLLKQATYSRIENGQLECEAAMLAQLVERLNISLHEFFYIHQNYQATNRQKLIQTFTRMELTPLHEITEQMELIQQYLNNNCDQDIQMLYYAYESLKELVETNQLHNVRAAAKQVWSYMQQLDHWYINDLELLNSIILYFPLDIAKEISNTALRRLNAYKEFEKDVTYLKLYFRLNLTTLYLEEQSFEVCLQELNDIHLAFQKTLTYQSLGFIYVRKIVCKYYLKQAFEMEMQHYNMLKQLFHDEAAFEFLDSELVLNEII